MYKQRRGIRRETLPREPDIEPMPKKATNGKRTQKGKKTQLSDWGKKKLMAGCPGGMGGKRPQGIWG